MHTFWCSKITPDGHKVAEKPALFGLGFFEERARGNPVLHTHIRKISLKQCLLNSKYHFYFNIAHVQ